MTDAEFETRLVASLYRAAELDYMADIPSDDELDRIIQPSPKFQRRMRAMLKNPSGFVRSRQRPVYLRVLRIAAAIVISFVVLLSAAMVVSPTVRAAVVDFVRSWFEDRTEYKTQDVPVGTGWTFGYIPEGFELAGEMDIPTELVHQYVNSNDNSDSLMIIISTGQEMVDNEHSTYYQATIAGHAADIYESNDPLYPSMIVIYYDSAGVIITLDAFFNINELIKIAGNISK